MSWQTITESDIFPRQAELGDIRSIKLPSGATGAEVLAGAIKQIVDETGGYLRAAVRKGFLAAMGPAGTVPPNLVQAVAVLVRRATLGRLPGLQALHNQIREEECTAAERMIRDVATGANMVEEHAAAVPTQVFAPSPMIAKRPKHFSSEDQEGI